MLRFQTLKRQANKKLSSPTKRSTVILTGAMSDVESLLK